MALTAALRRRTAALAVTTLVAALPGAAAAALALGQPAPDFTVPAALGGKTFTFSLAEALKKGPVVLYFYPKAFTSGCTVEANAFAQATPSFEALGATVIGMSNDDLETLKKFSVEACRNKFAVAADAGARITAQYDAALWIKRDMADRISYVISPQGKIVYVYSSMSPEGHITNTLQAVQEWKRKSSP